jgi:YD repeat-containing protein
MRTKTLLLVSALVLSIHAEGGELLPPADLEGQFADLQASANFSSTALHYLNEISSRRRLTTVFLNEQSPFYGVQMNYVNVGKGNLTFLTRDLVRLDRVPIVFGRVYDSSKSDTSDFGPGWKLSVAESIQTTPNGLRYVDASNSVYELQTDGARIWSPYPHLTGIKRGRVNQARLVLEVADLTKTFERFNNGFRLVEVRDRSGNSISLSYSADAVEKITSSGGRYVQILRDGTKRIVGATDDAGRTVTYQYDSSGRLGKSLDLAGEPFEFRYDDSGRLIAMSDPRRVVVIAARFDEAGRPVVVASQYDAMTYAYEPGNTLVTNGLQQAARFWHHAEGLTATIQDFAGGISNLDFDRDLHASTLTFDGAVMARADYVAGLLTTVATSISGVTRTQRLTYDGRGRLLRVNENDRPLARYGYDEAGNVVMAEDGSGKRLYRYAPTGSLVGMEIDGFRLGIRANGVGMVERVDWVSGQVNERHDHGAPNGRSARRVPAALEIAYGRTDRVQAITFTTPTQSIASEFQYTARGFRESGRYDLLEPTGQPAVSFSYDAVGNLTEWTYPGRYGQSYAIQHVVGPLNQVQTITPVGHEELQQTLEYDGSGRVINVVQGGQRDASFKYDELGRLTDIYVDSEHLLTAVHGPMDVDPVQEADNHSQFTTIDQPVSSAVFGSLETIGFIRPVGTPYGFARFVPAMARFVVGGQAVVPPDAAILTSLRRRNIASQATLNPTPIFGFDKPSSSLFIPPEYFSVNCAACSGGMNGLDVDRQGPAVVPVGSTVTFDAYSYNAWCEYSYYWEDTGWVQYPIDFVHQLSVNGNYLNTYYSPAPYLGGPTWDSFPVGFSTSGTKIVADTVWCSGCPNIFTAVAADAVCVKSSFTPPPNDSPPTIYQVSLVNGGASWGQTDVRKVDSTLVCTEVCASPAPLYRLEGNIGMDPASFIQVSTQLPPVGTCSAAPRTSANITHTQTHELVHANALVAVLNSYKASIGTEYSSLSSCETALSSLKNSADAAFTAELNNQANHNGHAGERRHAPVCPSPNGPTTEIECGLGGWTCTPYGNFYPGP